MAFTSHDGCIDVISLSIFNEHPVYVKLDNFGNDNKVYQAL